MSRVEKRPARVMCAGANVRSKILTTRSYSRTTRKQMSIEKGNANAMSIQLIMPSTIVTALHEQSNRGIEHNTMRSMGSIPLHVPIQCRVSLDLRRRAHVVRTGEGGLERLRRAGEGPAEAAREALAMRLGPPRLG